jgi:alkanesulfonate monooxygenase SsuD/methylene tetrahydromethanopterin reductase-like flavin-dependent oxidoreductase (luciferase family)
MATAVDDLSNGRLTLGLGAGWQEREHKNYGWELLDLPNRFDRFEEGVKIIHHLIRDDTPLDFKGEFYGLQEAVLLPRPQRSTELPILVGGNGPKRTLAITARYADWWNGVFLTPDRLAKLNDRLDEHLKNTGRSPENIKRSVMVGCEFGLNQMQVEQKVEVRTSGRLTPEELRQRGLVIGTPSEIVEQLGEYYDAGVQRVMLQWLDLDDLKGLEALAKGVLPQVQG